jgi:subtilisin family serine protease
MAAVSALFKDGSMPTTLRAALACAAMLICALLPASATAASRAVEAKILYRAASVPSDELFEEQWSLADDRLLGVQSAWDVTTGGNVTVAVIDTGADLDHPDLRDNLWRNPREVAGNGVDDDANGFVDDVHGADLVHRDGDPADDNGHGTHVAGILAARGANRLGVSGVAQRARVMVVKALGADAVGSALTMADAVRYAVANGAKVINMSVAGPTRSQAFEEAVRAASDAGVLMTVAAGNSGRDLDAQPEYPAAFSAPHVLAVAATNRTGRLIGMSNRGAGTVDLAAPGSGIVATADGGDYESRTGTSMAAPHVAGALVLLASARPDLGADALQAAVLGSARRGVAVTTGTLDVAGAMRRVVSASRWRSATRGGTVRGAARKRTAVRATLAR